MSGWLEPILIMRGVLSRGGLLENILQCLRALLNKNVNELVWVEHETLYT